MMEAVTVPPFERFYEEQREPVLVQLRRMLGRDAADDAFQETFLRALRAYPSLKHGQHLRAWAIAIRRSSPVCSAWASASLPSASACCWSPRIRETTARRLSSRARAASRSAGHVRDRLPSPPLN